MSKPVLHVVSLPHTQVNNEYVSCAYTAKHLKFVDMMVTIGYDVISYAGEHSECNSTEDVVINPDTAQERWFGKFDHHKNFYPITWDPNDSHWMESNANAIREINQRIQPHDIICVIAGRCQEQIARAFPKHMTVEYGIGYTGTFSPYRVFESYAHMHNVYGLQGSDNGKFYDAVIPNYFVPSDFNYKIEPVFEGENIRVINEPKDYYVFLGRFIERKGVQIAVEATRRLGAQLILAGQGVKDTTYGPNGTTLYGDGLTITGHHIEHIGHVDVKQRAKLLANAKATFMPTTYLEPFGGVSIESLMAGTPVIATDFGVFSETIIHGLVGYRARTVGEFTQFASDESLAALDRSSIREYAISNFSVDRVKYLYDDYFTQLMTLWEDGFYTTQTTSKDRYARFI